MNAVPTVQMPTISAAASRPANWPNATPAKGDADGADRPLDNHVLSSIRANPGVPLEPVRQLIASEVPKAVAAGTAEGAVPAAYESPAGAPAADAPAYQSLETALVVARVGPEVVLEADLLTPKALEFLEKVNG